MLLNDEQIEYRIDALERERSKLRRDEGEAAESDRMKRVSASASRLADIRIELDRLWDYLRQRRALRAAGEDPATAGIRDAYTVQHYLG